jgi:hypothetical protein
MLQDFSPLVGALSAPGSSGELQFTIWLDLTGVAHLFGDLPGAELNLLRAVRDRLARLGYLALTAAADTPGAAWALANYARPARSETSTTSEPAETSRPDPRDRASAAAEPVPLLVSGADTVTTPLDPDAPGEPAAPLAPKPPCTVAVTACELTAAVILSSLTEAVTCCGLVETVMPISE